MTVMQLLIVHLVIISNLLYTSEPDTTLIMAQDLPMLVSSQDLKDVPEASGTLEEIVYIYRQNRQKRREKQQSAIFLQEDLDVFKNFISENNHTESALTAKLLIANLLFGDANIIDLQFPKTIYQEIAKKYSDNWQGKMASYNLLGLEIYEHDPKFEKHKNIVALREESIKLLDLALFLDDSTKPDIRAYCSFDSFSKFCGLLGLIATFSQRLGEYEVAKEYYEKIMHRYPGTKMALKAENSLNQVQTKMDSSNNKQTTNEPPKRTALNENIVASSGETSTVVSDRQEQGITKEINTILSKENTIPHPKENNKNHVTLAFIAVISFILFVVVSLLFWGIGMSRKH